MPPDSHIVVPLSATLVISVAAFVVGFLGNMLAMRSLFVTSRACEECRGQCERRQSTMNETMTIAIQDLKKVTERMNECVFRMHGELSAIHSRLRTRASDKEGEI